MRFRLLVEESERDEAPREPLAGQVVKGGTR
jgi:hypothetical protein